MHAHASPTEIAAELLSVAPSARRDWLAARRVPSLALIEALKARSDSLVASEPAVALDAVEAAELVAALGEQPLEGALASWARGNWQMMHDPGAAVAAYRRALEPYRRAGEQLSVARLLTNLVFPLTEQGLLDQAAVAVDEARSLLLTLGEPAQLPLLVLEQNAGWLLHNQERYAEAMAAYERALALAYTLELPERAVDIQVNRTVTLARFGRLEEEEATLLASREQAERLGRRLTLARIELNLGDMYGAQGRLIDSLRRLQAAQAGFASLGNRMELGSVLLAEAALFSRLGALPEARNCYAEALERFSAHQMQPQIGIALLRGAIVERNAGDYAACARLLARADAVWSAVGQKRWQANVRLEQAELWLTRGDAERSLAVLTALPDVPGARLEAQQLAITAGAWALRYAEGDAGAFEHALAAHSSAYAAAVGHSDRLLERRVLAGLGRLQLERDPGSSRQQLERALELDEATRRTLSVEELKAEFQQQSADLLGPLMQLALARDEPLDALAAVWRVKGGPLLDLLSLVDEQADPHLAAAMDDVRRRLALHRWRLALEHSGDVPDSVREQLDPHTRELEDELRALRRRRLGAPVDTAPAVVRRLLAGMDADVLLEYVQCDGTLWALRATREGECRAVALAPLSAVGELLDDLQLSMQHAAGALSHEQPPDARLLDEVLPLLRHAYELLLAPLGQLPDAARVLVAPCSPLYLLPFGALHDGRRYLAERVDLEFMLSGALLGAPAASGASGGVLVLGSSAGGQLAGVQTEAAAIAAALPESELMIDRPRSVAELLEREVAPRVLHLAAHSVLREDAPLFSALRLTDELLSVEQCYELPLRGTRMVVLSGCTTTSGLDTGGALLAFQSALFAAGAGSAISSLWPVSDRQSVVWMERLYAFIAAGAAPAAAVRSTQRELLREQRHAHPAVWAAFMCTERSGTTS